MKKSKVIKPPIRYFGGKGGMFKEITAHFPPSNSYNIYLEPFGGSASILLSQPLGHVEIYNDLDSNVYSLYKVITDKVLFDLFKFKCDFAIYCEEVRKEYKELLKNKTLSLVDRAFYFWYVNRTSHNGIGGLSVNCCIRRKMSKSTSDFLSSIDRLKEIHDRMSAVLVLNKDAVELIKKWDDSNVFIYADSPYHQDTRTVARYNTDMDNKKQTEYVDMLLGIKYAKVLVSGYDCAEYKRLVDNGWQQIDIEINTIGGDFKPKKKTETLWKNY